MQLPALNQHKECHNHSDIQYEPLLNSTYDDESVVDILNAELGFSKYKVNNNRTSHSFWKFLALFNGACLIIALYYIFVHINKVTDENSIYETYEIEFTKPPMNYTRNYSSNINEIWNDYFDGKRPEKLQCQKFFDDDKKAMSAYNSSGRLTATEKQELRLAMDCESIRRRVMGNNTYPKLERTIAVARNIFMNYPLQEAFLSFAYHPDNFYCYVMDSKSNASFVKRMKALGECLPNVFIMEKMFDMDSSGHYQDHGHFLCMKTLIERDSKWQHILLLQNFDMIVRTMKEIVEMSKIFNGTQSIQVVGPIYGRYDNKANWTPKGLKLWKNETGKTKAQLETKLDIGKGNNEAFLSRDFVEAIFKELNVDNILNRFNDLKKVDFLMKLRFKTAYL
ncbi:hypothetical protein WR25_00924 isoform B [Diploscapter pachys]|uniref:Uncharacterized protein n=2 Tax=Diploscapter pachys TaxID=2018661 RepID=A0A2A2KVW7_9BILA|nr:hypothetical protein WR25_00924 isoform B [Diploscapter pachys]